MIVQNQNIDPSFLFAALDITCDVRTQAAMGIQQLEMLTVLLKRSKNELTSQYSAMKIIFHGCT